MSTVHQNPLEEHQMTFLAEIRIIQPSTGIAIQDPEELHQSPMLGECPPRDLPPEHQHPMYLSVLRYVKRCCFN